jgi:hypothetical protein
MARYTAPKVYYQSSILANTAVEVTHRSTLTWGNRTNNNGNFSMTIPIDPARLRFEPMLGGYIRLDPGDTLMRIEKKEKVCDDKGNFWWKLGGRPRMMDDEITRQAKNEGFFFRHVYNGVNAETYRTFRVGTPVTRIDKEDILHSSTYEDNLGGFEEVIEDTVTEAFSWGTVLVSQPKVIVTPATAAVIGTMTIPGNALSNSGSNAPSHPRAGETITQTLSTSTDSPFTTDQTIQISVGSASGSQGRMDRVTYPGSWFKNDVTRDEVLGGSTFVYYIERRDGTFVSWLILSAQPVGIVRKRTVTLKTEVEYRAEMWDYMNSLPNPSGHQPKIINRQVTQVDGGHKGYSFAIKSKGEVNKRYNVDFHLGDTISLNDTRLGVIYTGVVSGAVETIDGNGYNLDIEIDTLGANLEQRLNRVI